MAVSFHVDLGGFRDNQEAFLQAAACLRSNPHEARWIFASLYAHILALPAEDKSWRLLLAPVEEALFGLGRLTDPKAEAA